MNCILVVLTTLIILFAGVAQSLAAVEWEILNTLKTEDNILDVAMSNKGKWIFMLTEKGEVLIYSPNGKLRDRIMVGSSIEGIKAGSRENILLLTNRKSSTVQIIVLDFIYKINIERSPFKGRVDAPVTIAVFNDFE